MKKVVVIFADGFEETEGVSIVDVLRRAGLDVSMVGLDAVVVTGAHGIELSMDCTIDSITPNELDALVLPGGMPGAKNLADSRVVVDIIRSVHERGKHVAAICAAPIALAAAGIIDSRKVTCYPGFEQQLGNILHTAARVQVDGNIVTGAGPGAALEFAVTLVSELGDPDTAAELRKAMLVA